MRKNKRKNLVELNHDWMMMSVCDEASVMMSRDLAASVTRITVCHTLCHANPWPETILDITVWVFR